MSRDPGISPILAIAKRPAGRCDVAALGVRHRPMGVRCTKQRVGGWIAYWSVPPRRRGRARARPAPELSVIVPTFNERANIPLLVARLQRTLEGADWEVIFVDDNSLDGTAAAVRAIGETDLRVRCIPRTGRRGSAGGHHRG